MYNWKLNTAVKLAKENFLSDIQIAFDNGSSRPYHLHFVTRCGDTAQLVTTHTQKEKRKIRDFSTKNSVIKFLDDRFPDYGSLLNDEVKMTRAV